jgi:hypothetical protein
MVHRFKRQELYDLAWSQPLTKVARNLGVSDVAVAKACRRAGIPVPGLRHWAKVQHGKKVDRAPLPPQKPGKSDIVTITPQPSGSASLRLPPDVQKLVNNEEVEPGARIIVQKSLSKAHPIVQEWIKRTAAPIPKTENRRLRILSTLFSELEKRGHSVVPAAPNPTGNIAVKLLEEAVEFSLKERQKQSRVALTPEEKRYSFGLERGWRQVLEPTGKLIFMIQSWLDSGMRKQWSDTGRNPLDQQLNDIIAGLMSAAGCLRRRRLDREEEERQRLEANRKRRELEALEREKEQALKRLTQRVNAWILAGQIREYVAAVRNVAPTSNYSVSPAELEKRITRVLRFADEIDPLLTSDPLA